MQIQIQYDEAFSQLERNLLKQLEPSIHNIWIPTANSTLNLSWVLEISNEESLRIAVLKTQAIKFSKLHQESFFSLGGKTSDNLVAEFKEDFTRAAIYYRPVNP